MKRILQIGAALAILVGAYFLFFNDSKSDYISVLVFSKTEGYRHESIEDGQKDHPGTWNEAWI